MCVRTHEKTALLSAKYVPGPPKGVLTSSDTGAPVLFSTFQIRRREAPASKLKIFATTRTRPRRARARFARKNSRSHGRAASRDARAEEEERGRARPSGRGPAREMLTKAYIPKHSAALGRGAEHGRAASAVQPSAGEKISRVARIPKKSICMWCLSLEEKKSECAEEKI